MQRKADIVKLTETGHFDEVFEAVKKYPRALRAWFEQYTISEDFNPEGPPPVTVYLRDMQDATKPEADQEIEAIITDGDHSLVKEDLISATVMLNLLNAGLTKPTSGKHLASILMANGYSQFPARIRVPSGDRHRFWVHEDSDTLLGMDNKQMTELVRVRVEGATEEDFET